MKVLGLIVARGGSKGIPGKNSKLLGGRPLIDYTIQSAKESALIDEVILSSDDARIIEIARNGGISVIQHALSFLQKKGRDYDAVCLLQPTTPFRRQGLVDAAITKFKKAPMDSLISVREIPSDYNPHWAFEETEGGLKIATGEMVPVSRRQDLPPAYHRDGAIYLTKTQVILEQNSLLGKHIGFIVTGGDEDINLDTPEDWALAEERLKSRT
jgi:CMP-N,N'-diacetyllegionaminic acid synthase